MKSACHIRGGDDFQHRGIVPDRIGTKGLAHVTIQIDCFGHITTPFWVVFLAIAKSRPLHSVGNLVAKTLGQGQQSQWHYLCAESLLRKPAYNTRSDMLEMRTHRFSRFFAFALFQTVDKNQVLPTG